MYQIVSSENSQKRLQDFEGWVNGLASDIPWKRFFTRIHISQRDGGISYDA